MRYLKDLKKIIDYPSFISYHGGSRYKARGGGEKVLQNIVNIYNFNQERISRVNSGLKNRIILLIKCHINHKGRPLLMAGPRDIPLIMISFLLGKRANIYIQVPYLKAITIKDPIHGIISIFYIVACILFAHKILKNSSSTINLSFLRKTIILLPINCLSEYQNFKIDIDRDDKYQINFVCRLFPERGVGSRDFKNMLRLADEIALYNKSNQKKILLNHWGDAENNLIYELKKHSCNYFYNHGFEDEWYLKAKGRMIFISNYEGFGLAPLEAASYGFKTFVNEAFPIELLNCNNSIKRLITKKNKISILNQII